MYWICTLTYTSLWVKIRYSSKLQGKQCPSTDNFLLIVPCWTLRIILLGYSQYDLLTVTKLRKFLYPVCQTFLDLIQLKAWHKFWDSQKNNTICSGKGISRDNNGCNYCVEKGSWICDVMNFLWKWRLRGKGKSKIKDRQELLMRTFMGKPHVLLHAKGHFVIWGIRLFGAPTIWYVYSTTHTSHHSSIHVQINTPLTWNTESQQFFGWRCNPNGFANSLLQILCYLIMKTVPQKDKHQD